MMRVPTIAAALVALSSPAIAEEYRPPPVRVGSQLVVRPETNPTPAFDVGVQTFRSRRLKLDGTVTFVMPRALGLTGPLRRMTTVDLGVELLGEIGPWLDTGPWAALSLRAFSQDVHIDLRPVPVAGWRLNATLLRTRTWSTQLTTKVGLDLSPIDLARESAEVRRLIPVEGQVGLRFNLGHGRLPPPAAEGEPVDDEGDR